MPEMLVSTCWPFTKNKRRIQNFRETRDTKYIYRNELNKACFQYDMTYGDFKDLAKRIASDKVLRDIAIDIAKNKKNGGYQTGLASMAHKFFDKNSARSGVTTLASNSTFKNKIKQNLQLAEKLHKPIIRNFKKRTVYLSFKDNIWSADLADMQSISKLNKGNRFLFSFGKYAWVAPLKAKKVITIADAFQKNIKLFNEKTKQDMGKQRKQIFVIAFVKK